MFNNCRTKTPTIGENNSTQPHFNTNCKIMTQDVHKMNKWFSTFYTNFAAQKD